MWENQILNKMLKIHKINVYSKALESDDIFSQAWIWYVYYIINLLSDISQVKYSFIV